MISRPAFKNRIGDASYATRIGVQGVLEFLGADSNEETGFGIWTPGWGEPDNEYPYVVVDVEDGAVFVSDDYSDKDDAHRIDPPTAKAIGEAMEAESMESE